MATLDDKLLGEKTHYYCSSSEDEDEPNKSSTNPAESGVNQFLRGGYTHGALKQLPSTNTGPKGVIQDWQEFKRLEAEKRDGQEVGRLKLMEKLSLSCKSYLEEQTNQQQNQADEDLDKLLDEDPFMHEYIKKRMAQMMDKISIPSTIESRFGQLIHLKSGTDFVKAIDEEDKNVIVICHLFNLNIEGCVALNGCLQCLAEQYKFVKFCMLEANSAGMSREFEKRGVPALLIYKGGNLIGNFVRVTDEFSEDFFAPDVEAFLIDHGILPDQNLVPELMKQSSQKVSKRDDSDDD